jgi:hypothetical protein
MDGFPAESSIVGNLEYIWHNRLKHGSGKNLFVKIKQKKTREAAVVLFGP